MHIFHKWEVVYKYTLSNKTGWFEHRRCKVCDKEKIRHGLHISASMMDAGELGMELGFYAIKHPDVERDF